MHSRAKLIEWYVKQHKPAGWEYDVRAHDAYNVNFMFKIGEQEHGTYTVGVEPGKSVLAAVQRTLRVAFSDWHRRTRNTASFDAVRRGAALAEQDLNGVYDIPCTVRALEPQEFTVVEVEFTGNLRWRYAMPSLDLIRDAEAHVHRSIINGVRDMLHRDSTVAAAVHRARAARHRTSFTLTPPNLRDSWTVMYNAI